MHFSQKLVEPLLLFLCINKTKTPQLSLVLRIMYLEGLYVAHPECARVIIPRN